MIVNEDEYIMSSKTKKVKKQFNILDLFDENRKGVTMQSILLYIYLFLMLGVYPIITTDQYFNITVTRYYFFMYTTIIYTALSLVVFIAEEFLNARYKNTSINVDEGKKFYARPEFWMEAFMMANVFAYMVSIDKDMSRMGFKDGLGGRYMGMFTYIILTVVFLVIASGKKINKSIIYVPFVSALYAFIIAIFQHMGNDFMGYRDNIRKDLYDIYISTFGNINIFASFLTMCIPAFACVYIFSNNKIYKALSAIILTVGGMTLMVANSDSGFLGVVIAYLLIFLFSINDKKVKPFFDTIVMMFCGVFAQVLINRYYLDYNNKRGGISEALDNMPLMIGIGVLLGLICFAIRYVSKKYKDRLEQLNRRKVICNILVGVGICLVLFIVIGNIMDLSIFNFNYKWGNYRGMIWQICGDIFEKAPSTHKIFGYGNETVQILTRANYYDIMMENTNRVYDNAHNEVLQYLITTGIVGALSYVGLFVSSFVYILKNSSKNIFAYITLSVITGYFVQGLVNVNQPITTPFFFIFMALGVGYVRYIKKQEAYSE